MEAFEEGKVSEGNDGVVGHVNRIVLVLEGDEGAVGDEGAGTYLLVLHRDFQ